MAVPSDTTNLPAVPYPGHTPHMDLDGAMSLLRIVAARLGEGPTTVEESSDLMVLTARALMDMEPVLGYLDSVEYLEGHQEIYLQCRREWVMSRQGGQHTSAA